MGAPFESPIARGGTETARASLGLAGDATILTGPE